MGFVEDPALPLELSAMEVCFLTDSISNRDVEEGRDDSRQQPLARKVLLLLGSAYLELIKPDDMSDNVVELYVTEEMVWLLRSKVKTGDVGIDGQTNIGLGLLRKLYDLVLQFNSGMVDLEVVDEPERKRLRKEMMDRAQGKPDSEPDSEPDQDSDNGA